MSGSLLEVDVKLNLRNSLSVLKHKKRTWH
jgi:hypothetical protein